MLRKQTFRSGRFKVEPKREDSRGVFSKIKIQEIFNSYRVLATLCLIVIAILAIQFSDFSLSNPLGIAQAIIDSFSPYSQTFGQFPS